MMEESEYESLPTENFGVHMMAGAFAGIMEHCVMYPVDFVKVMSWFVCMIKFDRFPNEFAYGSVLHRRVHALPK